MKANPSNPSSPANLIFVCRNDLILCNDNMFRRNCMFGNVIGCAKEYKSLGHARRKAKLLGGVVAVIPAGMSIESSTIIIEKVKTIGPDGTDNWFKVVHHDLREFYEKTEPTEPTEPIPPLVWNKDIPSQVGWYWKRDPSDRRHGNPVVIQIRDYAGDLAIDNTILEGWESLKQYEWAGPIALPLEPDNA